MSDEPLHEAERAFDQVAQLSFRNRQYVPGPQPEEEPWGDDNLLRAGQDMGGSPARSRPSPGFGQAESDGRRRYSDPAIAPRTRWGMANPLRSFVLSR